MASVRDVVVLGRAGEGPGRLESVLRAEGPDGVILHDALRVEPATWAQDAYVALAPGHRAIATVVRLGECPGTSSAVGAVSCQPRAERRTLSAGGTLWRSSAASAADL